MKELDFLHEVIIDFARELCLNSVNLRDKYTHDHCMRVAWISEKILNKYLKRCKKNKRKIELKDFGYFPRTPGSDQYSAKYKPHTHMSLGSVIHDLGKLGWPDRVLHWDDPDLDILRSHPERGVSTLYKCLVQTFANRGINIGPFEDEYLWLLVMLFHHHDYSSNGKGNKGYPELDSISSKSLRDFATRHEDSLKPKSSSFLDINPLRVMLGIIRIADSLDACTSYRPNRKGKFSKYSKEDYKNEKKWPKIWDVAIKDIKQHVGSKYHPDVFKCFYSEYQLEDIMGKKLVGVKRDFWLIKKAAGGY